MLLKLDIGEILYWSVLIPLEWYHSGTTTRIRIARVTTDFLLKIIIILLYAVTGVLSSWNDKGNTKQRSMNRKFNKRSHHGKSPGPGVGLGSPSGKPVLNFLFKCLWLTIIRLLFFTWVFVYTAINTNTILVYMTT